jgi:LacI family transcriptional regulator
MVTSRPPTQADVARRAGVSSATVSFVINDRSDQTISEQTRIRVLDAVRDLGYRPNRAARSLRVSRTATIGFVNHEPADNPFSGMAIAGAHDVAWRRGSALLVVNTSRNSARLKAGISALLDRQVDAVLFSAVGTRMAVLPDELSPVPTVMINCFSPGDRLPCVLPAETTGGYEITKTVLAAGHSDVVALAGKPGSWATRARVRGHRRALADAGLDPRSATVLYGDFSTGSGFELTHGLLASGRRPTAIVCGNDRMALGAYLALGEAGLRIPDEVSVVGYDDQAMLAAELRPALTTVRLPYYEMGSWAAEQVLAAPTAIEQLAPRTYLPCELVVRESVAPPRP